MCRDFYDMLDARATDHPIPTIGKVIREQPNKNTLKIRDQKSILNTTFK